MAAQTTDIEGVHVVPHPLIKHHLASLRLVETSARDFRYRVQQISTLLIGEATRDYETMAVQGQGPLSVFTGDSVKVSYRCQCHGSLS